MNTLYALLVLCLIFSAVVAQIPCDDAYAAHCPEEAPGWNVGDCIKKNATPGDLSSECVAFMDMSETCRADIDTHCANKAYSGELISCLTEWTKPELLSEACKEALPKKQSRKDRGETKEQRARANKRKRTRQESVRQARSRDSL
jgi:hypothetical protein